MSRERPDIGNEIQIIADVVGRLDELPPSAHDRVMRYLWDRYLGHPWWMRPVTIGLIHAVGGQPAGEGG